MLAQGCSDACGAVQAQQRYRERRKAKFNEMEESLHALASQVEQMSNVQQQNSTLQVLLTLNLASVTCSTRRLKHLLSAASSLAYLSWSRNESRCDSMIFRA